MTEYQKSLLNDALQTIRDLRDYPYNNEERESLIKLVADRLSALQSDIHARERSRGLTATLKDIAGGESWN